MPVISELLKYHVNNIDYEEATIQSKIESLKSQIQKIEKVFGENNNFICGT